MTARATKIAAIVLILCAQTWATPDIPTEIPVVEVEKKLPSLEFMPPGSVLKSVSLPRYVENKLASLITAVEIKIITADQLDSKNVHVYLYEKTGRLSTTLSMVEASYFLSTKLLQSVGQTIIQDRLFHMEGANTTYDTVRRVGYIAGPVRTTIYSATLNQKSK